MRLNHYDAVRKELRWEGGRAVVERDRLTVAAVAIVLVAGLAGAVYVSGLAGPIFGGDPGTSTPTPATPATPTEGNVGERVTDESGDGGGDGDGGGNTATATPPAYDFQFRILNTTSCGNTCRDVTVRLTNDGRETATGVTAQSRMYAGGGQIWSGTEDIGTVEPGESVTRTKRVKLGVFDAAKVQQNGGYVTIETTVTWDDGSQTFTQRVKAT